MSAATLDTADVPWVKAYGGWAGPIEYESWRWAFGAKRDPLGDSFACSVSEQEWWEQNTDG